MAKVKYPTIPEDVVINLEVSGGFYKDLSALLLSLSKELKQEEYASCVEKLKTGKPADNLKEANVMLITALVFTLEYTAKEQGLTKEIEVEVPDETPNP
jgi:hypothetical protein